jgi:hypothetical protein
MADDNPTTPAPTPPADPPKPPENAPTPPAEPAPTPPSEPTEHPKHDDGPILAAIGELKNIVVGLATVQSTDQSPVKKPWFARGGKS